MKKSELKTIWKLAKFTWIGGFIFWVLESIFFIIIYGWHWKATEKAEIYCDEIVKTLWRIALFLTIYCALNLFLKLRSNKN